MRRLLLVLLLSAAPQAALAEPDKPASDHAGQWWTNAAGCEYVRSDVRARPVWHLISRDARTDCPIRIAGDPSAPRPPERPIPRGI